MKLPVYASRDRNLVSAKKMSSLRGYDVESDDELVCTVEVDEYMADNMESPKVYPTAIAMPQFDKWTMGIVEETFDGVLMAVPPSISKNNMQSIINKGGMTIVVSYPNDREDDEITFDDSSFAHWVFRKVAMEVDL